MACLGALRLPGVLTGLMETAIIAIALEILYLIQGQERIHE